MMEEKIFEFRYEVFDNINELKEEDAGLLTRAREITRLAYAPYSRFHVGAVARLSNGQAVSGTNQENASYPVGICAERVLLGNAATQFPGVSIETLAISYASEDVMSDHPISPCGMCRQSLLEYESRTLSPMRLILAGQQGKIILLNTAKFLLPLAFTGEELH